MLYYTHEKIGIFIDGSNLHTSARSLGIDIDYKKLLKKFADMGTLTRACYYTALTDDQEYSPLRPLVDWLDYNGYTMVTKPVKEFTDSMGRRRIKGNMDVEIAIDVIQMADHLDHIVLFSGDGDFRYLIQAVQDKGVRTTVISTARTSPPMIADELRRQADNFIDLADLAPDIARKIPDHELRRRIENGEDFAPSILSEEMLPIPADDDILPDAMEAQHETVEETPSPEPEQKVEMDTFSIIPSEFDPKNFLKDSPPSCDEESPVKKAVGA